MPTSAPPAKTILVTGDLVLDHHLYEGTRPNPQDQHQRALSSRVEWGGADLLCRLLKRVELERKISVLLKSRTERQKNALHAARKSNPHAPEFKEPAIPTADDPDLKSIPTEAETVLAWGDLPQPDFHGCVPASICAAHGYALFSPMPRSPKDDGLVWRVSKVMGYGIPEGACLPAGISPSVSLAANLPRMRQVVCLDDAGGEFRNLTGRAAKNWCLPSRSRVKGPLPWIALKLSGNLEHGRLWNELALRKDLHPKLAVIVAAQELRNMNVRLSKGLSWERSVEHLIFELSHNPALHRLKMARHVIVHFSIDAAVWIDFTDRRRPQTVLVFDAANAEGEWAEAFEGNAFAYQTCLAAAICKKLATLDEKEESVDVATAAQAMEAGLSAMRLLRSDGHGPTFDKTGNLLPPKGFPVPALARELLNPTQSFSYISVPQAVWVAARQGNPNSSWTILSHTQNPRQTRQPLYGLARQIVLRGEIALSRLPHLRIGKLLTTDRTDMEALRTLRRLFNAYKAKSNPGKKPLSIGVFGPPGAGKSYAVKELTLGIFAPPGAKEYAGWREFNISQFDGIEDLIGAFHQVRDLVLQGLIPVVFWDEFDSSKYKWLQYLLAPMQDGRFQQGEATHTIGKCIFIFAGGTSWTFDSFGEFESRGDRDQFQLAKGPDFKSRLDGAYDVLGPNQSVIPPKNKMGKPIQTASKTKWERNLDDIYFPIRRALMIRGLLGLKPGHGIEFDPGLLTAVLQNDFYVHGARSLEKVIEPLAQRKNLLNQSLKPVRSSLPAPNQLRLHVRHPEAFHRLCREQFPPAMLSQTVILKLAQAIHAHWEKGLSRNGQFNPNAKAWREVPADIRHANESAARRIPEVLSLAGLHLIRGKATPKERDEIAAYLALHLDLLAEAEHEGWMDDRKASGWIYDEKRDDAKRYHPCLIPFQNLSVIEQNKDRDAVTHYPDLADLIGHKIAFVKPPKGKRR